MRVLVMDGILCNLCATQGFNSGFMCYKYKQKCVCIASVESFILFFFSGDDLH